MRPIPLPEGLLNERQARSVVFLPPLGVSDDDCGTVEAMVERVEGALPWVVRVAIALDPGDVDRLMAGEPIWMSMYSSLPGGLHPFSVDFLPAVVE